MARTPRMTTPKPRKPRAPRYPKVKPVEPFISLADVKPSVRKETPKKRAWWAWGIGALLLVAAYAEKERIQGYVHLIKPPVLVDDVKTPAGDEAKPVTEAPAVPETVKVTDAGTPEALTKIRDLKKFYLQADRADGRIVLRTGGNPTWRFNNPGRIIHGDYTRSMGAIGSDGVTAVFPTYEQGKEAMKKYLFTDASEYREQTLEQAFLNKYLSDILKATGAVNGTKLKELTEEQQEKLMAVVQEKEGWLEGKITVFENEADFKERGW